MKTRNKKTLTLDEIQRITKLYTLEKWHPSAIAADLHLGIEVIENYIAIFEAGTVALYAEKNDYKQRVYEENAEQLAEIRKNEELGIPCSFKDLPEYQELVDKGIILTC